jgi:subtilisin family serine protease
LKKILFSLGLVTFISLSAAAGKRKNKIPVLEPVPPQEAQRPDPHGQKYWYFPAMNILEAWQMTYGSPHTAIAVIDSGIHYNHPDLRPALFENSAEIPFNGIDDDRNGFVDDYIGWNFNEGGPLPFDDNGHGTFIASIIAAQRSNGEGGMGICPLCRLVSLRFLDADGAGDDEDLLKSIDYATRMGVKIMNISTAGEGYDRDLHNALRRAEAKDILVVVSSGNDGDSNDKYGIYPANFEMDNLMTVGSTDQSGKWWENANYSPTKVHIAAPGENLWGAWPDGKWYTGNGTSFSTPIVAAIAGLVRSVNPQLTAAQTKQILMRTASVIPALKSKCASSGIVNAFRAVECARDPRLPCLSR